MVFFGMPCTLRKLTLFVIGIPGSPHILNRTQCFKNRGHEVIIFSRIDSTELARTVFKRFPIAKLFQNYLSAIKLFFELRRRDPDIIHVHYAYSPLAWTLPLLTDRPIVVSVMGGDILFEEQGDPTVFGKKLTINLLKNSNLITSKSDYLTSYLKQLDPGLTPKTKRIIWGVDLTKFKRNDAGWLRKKLNLKSNDTVILSPRSLRPIYNIELIIEALPKILDALPNTKLIITEFQCENNYKKQLMNLVTRLRLKDHIIFTGKIEQADMQGYYSLADLSIAVPSSDGIPQSLLEAMACEVPNIVSSLPHYKEIIRHGESAYFTDLDSCSIAESVLNLMKEPALRKRIAQKAKEIVESSANCDLDVEQVETAYYKLISSPSTRRNLERFKFKSLIFTLSYFVEILIKKVFFVRI